MSAVSFQDISAAQGRISHISYDSAYSQLARKSANEVQRPLSASKSLIGGQTSTVATAMNLVTTMVGAGILAFPSTFARGGWYLAPWLLVCSTAVTLEIGMLIDRICVMSEEKAASGARYSFGSCIEKYEDLGEAAFGLPGKRIVSLVANLFMLNICGAFMILVGSSMELLSVGFVDFFVQYGYGGKWVGWVCLPFRFWVLVMSGAFAPLALLDDMSFISRLSFVGVIASFIYVIAIAEGGLSSSAGGASTAVEHQSYPKKFGDVGMVISVMLLGFSCQTVLPTVRSEMLHPTQLHVAIKTSTITVLLVYMCAGMIGFYAWGDRVEGNVLLSMKNTRDAPLVAGMVLAFAVVANLLVTFPIIMQCVAKALESHLGGGFSLVGRLSLFACAMFVGFFCPYFLEFLGLVASVLGIVMGICIPLACYWKLRADGSGNEGAGGRGPPSIQEYAKHGMILLFGAVALIYGTIDGVAGLVQKMQNPFSLSDRAFPLPTSWASEAWARV